VTDHPYLTLDVFTSVPFGGNQLAVFPDAREIPEDALLSITREFNFSETTFCYPPTNPAHTKRVRIFTPTGEIPFAGHPTVGTAVALCGLAHRARHDPGAVDAASRLVLEEGVGPVSVTVRAEPDGVTFAQFAVAKLPEIGPSAPSRGMLAEILGLDAEDILGSPLSPQAISCGIPFLLVPLRSVSAVSRARVRFDKWEATLKASWAPEVFVFAKDPQGEAHYRARMFAPGLNITEDPATGSANACFAGYLAARANVQDGTLRWTVDQGIEMGRASQLEIEADKVGGAITAIRVGGRAVVVSEGTLRRP
jgi:trans-2,3-dihydro-3-hydroxyanthranilate isomerase